MALRDTLEAVLREYDSAKLTTFVGNPLLHSSVKKQFSTLNERLDQPP